MEITGRIITVLPVQTGQSSRGEWMRQDVVLDITQGQYEKRMAVTIFGQEKVQRFAPLLQIGATVQVSFEIDAHEYNGRWFNSIMAWNIVGYQQQGMVQQPQYYQPVPAQQQPVQQGYGQPPVVQAAPQYQPQPAAPQYQPPVQVQGFAQQAEAYAEADELPF